MLTEAKLKKIIDKHNLKELRPNLYYGTMSDNRAITVSFLYLNFKIYFGHLAFLYYADDVYYKDGLNYLTRDEFRKLREAWELEREIERLIDE